MSERGATPLTEAGRALLRDWDRQPLSESDVRYLILRTEAESAALAVTQEHGVAVDSNRLAETHGATLRRLRDAVIRYQVAVGRAPKNYSEQEATEAFKE